jgi:hypothetical protein
VTSHDAPQNWIVIILDIVLCSFPPWSLNYSWNSFYVDTVIIRILKDFLALFDRIIYDEYRCYKRKKFDYPSGYVSSDIMTRYTDLEMKAIIKAVSELISKNGIPEKDLKYECNKKNIGKKARQSALIKLVAEGTIIPEAIVKKNGSRVRFKPNMYPSTIDISQCSSNEIKGLKQHMKKDRRRDSHKVCLTRNQIHALGIRFKYTGRHKISLISEDF